jgi:hypothetical protein
LVLSEQTSLLSVELEAEKFYNECKKALKLEPMDSAVISALSWDWKDPYKYTGMQHACWSWVIIAAIF